MNEIFAFSGASTIAVLGFGFLLGLKHATEADHLAAVSTMVARRKSVWSAAFTGGLWGLGHTISLLAAGILVLLLDFHISESTERWLEACVGIMLALLGFNVIRKVVAGGYLHFHEHDHGDHVHVHPHVHGAKTADAHHGSRFSPRALIVGMVHGMAGSAALMLLIIPTIGSRALGMLYVLIFGLGSIGGMMLMSFLVGLPFHFTALRFNRFNYVLQAGAGLVSVLLGLSMIYEKAFSAA